jgi:ABC-type transport system involved in Fe-S cluster assembly fused permease/ATPase subunit
MFSFSMKQLLQLTPLLMQLSKKLSARSLEIAVLTIAHRIHTVIGSDLVIVFSEGMPHCEQTTPKLLDPV